MKVLIGIQARSGSQRFPGKIYERIGPKELIRWSYDACRAAQESLSKKNYSSQVKILCPHTDDQLVGFCEQNLIGYLRPFCDENDLIRRYLLAAEETESDAVIRITADCWQTNPSLVDELTSELIIKQKADYASNTIHRSFMEGLDIQGCSIKALRWFDEHQKEQREHPFVLFDNNEIIRQEFEKAGLRYSELINPRNPWVIRTSIDRPDDLEFARKIYAKNEADRQFMAGKNEKLFSSRGDRDEQQETQPIC